MVIRQRYKQCKQDGKIKSNDSIILRGELFASFPALIKNHFLARLLSRSSLFSRNSRTSEFLTQISRENITCLVVRFSLFTNVFINSQCCWIPFCLFPTAKFAVQIFLQLRELFLFSRLGLFLPPSLIHRPGWRNQ